MSVNLSTVQKWAKEVDSLGEWLCFGEHDRKVEWIACALCCKHKDRLRAVWNYSVAIVDGFRSTVLKKDNVVKHSHSDMLSKARQMERRQLLIKFWGLLTTYEIVSQSAMQNFQSESISGEIVLDLHCPMTCPMTKESLIFVM